MSINPRSLPNTYNIMHQGNKVGCGLPAREFAQSTIFTSAI